MAKFSAESLLAKLTGRAPNAGESDVWTDLTATPPQHDPPGAPVIETDSPPATVGALAAAQSLAGPAPYVPPSVAPVPKVAPAPLISPPTRPSAEPSPAGADAKLNELLGRLERIAKPGVVAPPPAPEREFIPLAPNSLREASLNEATVEELILKFLLSFGVCSGRDISEQIKLTFKIVDDLLRDMKASQLVVYRGTAMAGDYRYQLTDMGRERARRYAEHCTYFGSAPVSLKDYIDSVAEQSITKQNPTGEDLERAFDDLLLSKRMMNRLGPAINSGRGLFLYGAPGNGKSSIAERVTRAFGQTIWIPRAIGVDGEIIRFFDPSSHEHMPLEKQEGLLDDREIDARWIRVRRPTIIVGGELTMANLEVTINTTTGINEAPLQLKSNCGTLVIDDFGRQRMSTDELLNRWIVPLEKRFDFLNLPNGKKIQVPFDQLIIFSTNLQPKDLVDDAFLRRIPYKIDVIDPTEDEFRKLFEIVAEKMGFEFQGEAFEYLMKTHYRGGKRPLRCCHPRDILLQIKNFCLFQKQPFEMTRENLDFAVENYFAVM